MPSVYDKQIIFVSVISEWEQITSLLPMLGIPVTHEEYI